MGAIDLKELPEPIARGLEVVAEMARILAGKKKSIPSEEIIFGIRKGAVVGQLTREEIYNDDQ